MEDYEAALRAVAHDQLNVELMESRVRELQAELRAAEARLEREKENPAERNPGAESKSQKISWYAPYPSRSSQDDAPLVECLVWKRRERHREADCFQILRILGVFDSTV